MRIDDLLPLVVKSRFDDRPIHCPSNRAGRVSSVSHLHDRADQESTLRTPRRRATLFRSLFARIPRRLGRSASNGLRSIRPHCNATRDFQVRPHDRRSSCGRRECNDGMRVGSPFISARGADPDRSSEAWGRGTRAPGATQPFKEETRSHPPRTVLPGLGLHQNCSRHPVCDFPICSRDRKSGVDGTARWGERPRRARRSSGSHCRTIVGVPDRSRSGDFRRPARCRRVLLRVRPRRDPARTEVIRLGCRRSSALLHFVWERADRTDRHSSRSRELRGVERGLAGPCRSDHGRCRATGRDQSCRARRVVAAGAPIGTPAVGGRRTLPRWTGVALPGIRQRSRKGMVEA